jgi:hypothetical protein
MQGSQYDPASSARLDTEISVIRQEALRGRSHTPREAARAEQQFD